MNKKRYFAAVTKTYEQDQVFGVTKIMNKKTCFVVVTKKCLHKVFGGDDHNVRISGDHSCQQFPSSVRKMSLKEHLTKQETQGKKHQSVCTACVLHLVSYAQTYVDVQIMC